MVLLLFRLTAVFLIQCLFAKSQYPCDHNKDLTSTVATLLCAVESGKLRIDLESNAVLNAGCLIGREDRCKYVRSVPTVAEIPPSPPPPAAKMKEYQRLASIAEGFIEQTWWRQGFASDLLLLSHNDSELPKKQFSAKKIRNKRLKNMFQCVLRQQFIRKSYDFNAAVDRSKFDREEAKFNCTAMAHAVTPG